ncbi:MgtC/SapB transporter [uncultured Alphaproteobacteria bacterium]|uniref:Protein MgtC n=1 Tax=uncultured Alphaproteobacteria bacterium TaxID=91750 RepID=A0A212JAS8_9PROT|nr:MgtC/SapB transporter [uncultured Alphaproteobacteria bacterium]
MIALTPDERDGLLRLLAATAVGMAIGLNRDLHGKPTGTRTLGLVGLGAALVAIVCVRVDGMRENPDALSRVIQGVIQGVLTGIGFVGAGVVIRDRRNLSVHGLTTAATVWMTAALGIACALASWPFVALGAVVTLVLLVLAKPLDAVLDKRARRRNGYRPLPHDEVSTPLDGPQ